MKIDIYCGLYKKTLVKSFDILKLATGSYGWWWWDCENILRMIAKAHTKIFKTFMHVLATSFFEHI